MPLYARIRTALHRLWELSIWHPTAIEPDEWKFRNLMRVWLPIYDFLGIFAGLWAAGFGSPILHRLFPDGYTIDILGYALALISGVCMLGVVFPRIPRVETVGKMLLVGLLGSYAAAIGIFNASGEITSWFVVFIVLMVLPLPLFRLGMLGEEKKERREDSE